MTTKLKTNATNAGVKGNLHCDTISKETSRKTKQLPLCFCSPFVEFMSNMFTAFSKE